MKRHLDENESNDGKVELSEEERALYDRQIRLWGLEAQKKLAKYKVLICGMTGLGGEVAKNLILAGVAKVTLSDVKVVTADDIMSNFMISKESIGKNRATASEDYARRLNPMVNINVIEKSLLDICDTPELKDYDVVILCEMTSLDDIIKINNTCRDSNVKFIVGNVWSMHGFFFSDLCTHEYVYEQPITNKAKVAKIEKRKVDFQPFEKIFDHKFSTSRSDPLNKRTSTDFYNLFVLLEHYRSNKEHPSTLEDIQKLVDVVKDRLEAPAEKFEKISQFEGTLSKAAPSVSAIVGGALAQEVVKVASQKDDPFKNVFCFNGVACEGLILAL